MKKYKKSNKEIDLITIIIPAYNLENHIEYCINSIQEQTYSNLEIIVVDDGSTDNTYHICSSIAQLDSRILVFHQENKGVSAARNLGLENANGKYIMFVDGDDALRIDCVQSLYNDLVQHNADMSLCKFELIKDINDMYLKKWNSKKLSKEVTILYGNLQEEFLNGTFSGSCCMKLFNASKILNTRFVENKTNNEDKFFIYESLKNMNLITIRQDKLYLYYFRNDSASKNRKTLPYDQIYFAEEILNDVKINYKNLFVLAKKNYFLTNIDFIHRIMRLKTTRKEKKQYFNKYKKNIVNFDKKIIKMVKPKYRIDIFVMRFSYIIYNIFFKISYFFKSN